MPPTLRQQVTYMTRLVVDVLAQHSREVGLVPRGGGDPRRQLLVPHEVMAAENLAISVREVGHNLTVGEVEDVELRLDELPLIGRQFSVPIVVSIIERLLTFCPLAGVS